MRDWLTIRFRWRREVALPDGRRLDAALWLHEKTDVPDIALEWEWDNNKLHREFASGDFVKTLTFPALSALAIVQTRADGRRGSFQADDTIRQIRAIHAARRIDGRPAGVVDIRRTFHSSQRVEFVSTFHDLTTEKTRQLPGFRFQ